MHRYKHTHGLGKSGTIQTKLLAMIISEQSHLKDLVVIQ